MEAGARPGPGAGVSDPFFTLHHGLDREGPGEAADVLWALEVAGVTGAARVLDAGCGPGADSETLAEALSEARIEAVDAWPGFAEAAAARLARFGERVTVREGDMLAVRGPYELVWCAGAIYFAGVTEGLRAWRDTLAPSGVVAFSEPVLEAGASGGARAFWDGYPAVTDRAGVAGHVEAAGFEVIDMRPVIGAPWEAYYGPLEARVAELRPGADEALAAVLDEAAREIALWRAHREEIAYGLFVVRPV